MAEAGSTLLGADKSSDPDTSGSNTPLKEKVKDLTFMNKVTHLGKSFTDTEKQKWWNAHSKKLKVGLIRNKELDVAIQIFTESFDFSKKLRNKNSGTNSYVDITCPEPSADELNTIDELPRQEEPVSEADNTASQADEEASVSPSRANLNNLELGSNVGRLFVNGPDAPAGPVHIARPAVGGGEENQESVSPSQLNANEPVGESTGEPVGESTGEPVGEPNDNDSQLANDLYQAGFDTDGNIQPEELNGTPETIGTASDFERLYLGWMNNPAQPIDDSEKKVRKNTLKSLFRFVFGTKQINDVTATKIQKKFRIAYTPLTVAEKLPCKDEMGALWEDFRMSLVYRRRLAVCELYAARDTVGEATQYVEQKKKLILGLRDLINLLDQTVYPCVEYGYNASMMVDDDEDDLMADTDYVRLLKVFRTFVKDKKEGRKFYSLLNLKKEFSKKDPVSEQAQTLYDELLALLTWTAGEAEATAKIATLESKLKDIKEIAAQQEIDIQELEDLVLLLSVVLALSEKMHKIQLALEKINCTLECCCKEKKDKDRSVLQAQLRKLQEDYHILEKKLKKQSCDDCPEVEELEDIILVLTSIITSMSQIHKIDRSLLELKHALDLCCERKKAAKRCENRLAKLEKKLTGQTAQARASLLVAQQGRASARKMIDDLNEQIRGLRAQLEKVIKEAEEKRNELQGLLDDERSKGGKKTSEYRKEVDRLGEELRQARESLRRATERADDEARTAEEARRNANEARREAEGARRNANEARRNADERIQRAEEDARRAREAADAAIEEARRLQREAEEARRAADEAAEAARGGEADAQREADAARRRAEGAEKAAAEQQAAAEEARRLQRECDEALARAQLERNAAVRRAEGAEEQAAVAQAAAREAERLRAEADAARTEAEAAAAGAAATAAEANGRAAAANAAAEQANQDRDAALAARDSAQAEADEAARGAAAAREQARQAGANRNAARDQAAIAAAEAEALRAHLAAQAAAAAAEREAAAARLAQLQAEADEAAARAAARIAEIEAAAAQNRNRSSREAEEARREIARIQREAEEARQRAEGAMKGLREQYEAELEGLSTELAQTRKNRNAARTALNELREAMRDQEREAAAAIAQAQREKAEAEQALANLQEASEEERAAAAAALAEKQAQLDRAEAENTRLARENADLEAANAELAGRLRALQDILERERRAAAEREEALQTDLEEVRRQAGEDAEAAAARESALRAQHAAELAAAAERQRALQEQMRQAEEAHRAELARLQADHETAMRNALAAQKANLNRQRNEAVAGAVGAERARANAELAAEQEAAAAREAAAAAALAAQQRAAAAAAALAQSMIDGLQGQLSAEVQTGNMKSAAIANLSARIRAMEGAAEAERARRAAEEEEEAERRRRQAEEEEAERRRKAAANAEEAERRRKAAANAEEAERRRRQAEEEEEHRRKAEANAEEAERSRRQAEEEEAERRRKAAANAEEEEARRRAAASVPSPAALEVREETLRNSKEEFLYKLIQSVQGDMIQVKQVLKMIIEQLQIFGRSIKDSEGKNLDNYMTDFLQENPFAAVDARGDMRPIKTTKDFWAFSKAGVGYIFTAGADDAVILPYLVDRIIDLISRFAETTEYAGVDVFTIPGMATAISGSLEGLGFQVTKTQTVQREVIPALKELSSAEIAVFQMQRALGLATRLAPPEDPPSLARLHARMRANPVFMESIGNRLRVLLKLPPREPVTTYLEAYRGLSAEARDRIEPSMVELAGRDTGRQKFWRQTRADLEYLAQSGQRVTPLPVKRGGGGTPKDDSGSFCQTMITLLLLEAKQSHEFDIQEFLDKAGTTLDDLGQCPLVLHMLNELIDEAMNQNMKENGYVFSPSNNDSNEFNINLEDAYYNRFSPEQQEILKSMGPSITFHSETPESYREILGTNAYFLNGSVSEENEDTPLYGLGDDEDPVSLTKEERESIERKGAGVPLGALLFLYLMCLRDLKDSGENPSLDSKCPLPTLKPSRKSRASTPKRKA